MSERKQKMPPELSRALTLARRVAFDLSLLHDSARAADLPFVQLAKVRRAQREMKDLLREVNAQTEAHVEAKTINAIRARRAS